MGLSRSHLRRRVADVTDPRWRPREWPKRPRSRSAGLACMQSRCESPPTTPTSFFRGVISPSGVSRSTCSGYPVLVDWSSLPFFRYNVRYTAHLHNLWYNVPLDGPQRSLGRGHLVLESAAPRSGGRSGREAVGLLAVTPLLCYSPGADGPAEGPPVRPACCASASPEKRPVTTSSGSSRKRAYTREA